MEMAAITCIGPSGGLERTRPAPDMHAVLKDILEHKQLEVAAAREEAKELMNNTINDDAKEDEAAAVRKAAREIGDA